VLTRKRYPDSRLSATVADNFDTPDGTIPPQSCGFSKFPVITTVVADEQQT
jgi:hypothetical protein